MKKDQQFEALCEEFLTKRYYAPRVTLSLEFKKALVKEYQKLSSENIPPVRFQKAISFFIDQLVQAKR
jgi:hypothetical protein